VIDLKVLRENPELVRASQRDRGEDAALVDLVLAADERRRSLISEFESLRAEQNALSKRVGSATPTERSVLLESAKELANAVKRADAQRADAETALREATLGLSNIVEAGVPIGSEENFVVLEHVGTPRDFAAEGFVPLDHVELGKVLGAIDTERGAKVSGARFYYLTGNGALLEFALVNLAMAQAVEHGFIPVIPPVLVKPAAMDFSVKPQRMSSDLKQMISIWLALAKFHWRPITWTKSLMVPSCLCDTQGFPHVFVARPDLMEKIPAELFEFINSIKSKCFLSARQKERKQNTEGF
jgi:seryl-tRNA synthetase